MWAMVIHASAEATDFSKSLASLRHRPSQAKVRSTNPAARQDFKTFGLVGTFDDFECPFPDFLQPLFELVARIAAISEDMKQPRPPVFDGFQEIGSAVAILNIGAVHHEA
ncbi:hypothetical protein SAMN04244575_06080, partial [Sinorhizobium meliloti]